MSLAGTRVFIVEDETLVLMLLEDSLADLGCDVVASALRIDDAIAKAGELTFDIAILDVNVAGKSIDPVADLLVKRNIPFIFTSGYGRASLPTSHRGKTLLSKPYAAPQLQAALLEAIESARSTRTPGGVPDPSS